MYCSTWSCFLKIITVFDSIDIILFTLTSIYSNKKIDGEKMMEVDRRFKEKNQTDKEKVW